MSIIIIYKQNTFLLPLYNKLKRCLEFYYHWGWKKYLFKMYFADMMIKSECTSSYNVPNFFQ